MNPLVAAKPSRSFFKSLATAVASLLLISPVFAAGDNSVTLAWDPNPETNIAGYRLKYGTTSGVYPGTVEAGTSTTATASGLNQGTTYYFVVLAYNTAGQTSPASSQVAYTVPGTPNTAPTAGTFAVTVAEDGQASATLNGSDSEGDVLSFTIVTAPTKGILTGTAPNLTYQPAANATGTDSFTYRTNDGALDSATATVSITITPANDAPVASSFSISAVAGGSAAATLSGSDIDGDGLTYSIVTAPTKGTLTGTAPNLTYRPAANATGSDSFTYRANDGTVNSANTATVSITITPPANTAPVATSRSLVTNEDTGAACTLAGTDAEGSPLTFTVLTQPAKGTITGTAPNLIYSPNANANGSDSFTFRVNDGSANSTAATVSITITPVNDAPAATPRSATTPRNTAVAIAIAGTDIDSNPLTYTVLTQPANGVLSGTAPNLTYTPVTGFTGADSFTFLVNDGTVNSTAATVSITVTDPATNTAPVATSRTLVTNEDTNAACTLAGTDADANPLTFTVLTQPTKGTFTGSAPNLTYRPNANAVGSDSFTFRVNDGTLNSPAATVSITITPVNDAPVATPFSLSASDSAGTPATLVGTDIDGDTLAYGIVTPPAKGVLTGTVPNLSYRANAGATGTDSFTYRVGDGFLHSPVVTVSISIISGNNRPVALTATTSTLKSKAVRVQLAGTDSDADPLAFRLISTPVNGTLTGTPPNVTYKPAAGFVGDDRFSFVVNDGTTDSGLGIVHVKVKGANQKPVATARTAQTNQSTPVPITLAGTDPDGDALTYAIVARPANGTITGNSPDFIYTPATGFKGTDRFTFTASDRAATSAAATVTIAVVNPNNRAPVAGPINLSIPAKKAALVTLGGTDADGDPLTFRIVSQPATGKITGRAPALKYKPAATFTGTVTFTYVANDGVLDSAPATVTLTVAAPVTTARAIGKSKSAVESGTTPVPALALRPDPARPGILLLEVTGTPGDTYTLQHSTDLGAWSDSGQVLLDDNGGLTLEKEIPAGTTRGFYRLLTP